MYMLVTHAHTHSYTVKVLLEAGAHASTKNDRGLSPNMICAQCGDEEMIAAFETHGQVRECVYVYV